MKKMTLNKRQDDIKAITAFYNGCIVGILYKDPIMPKELVEYAALTIMIKALAKNYFLQEFIDNFDLSQLDRLNIEKLYKFEQDK